MAVLSNSFSVFILLGIHNFVSFLVFIVLEIYNFVLWLKLEKARDIIMSWWFLMKSWLTAWKIRWLKKVAHSMGASNYLPVNGCVKMGSMALPVMEFQDKGYKLRFLQATEAPHLSEPQKSIISLGYVDFHTKIFLILYLWSWNSITDIAIMGTVGSGWLK